MFVRMDANHDEQISLEEYLDAIEQTHKIAVDMAERRKAFLLELDRPWGGADGYTSEEAFKDLSETEWKHIRTSFRFVDINGDGCIERNEAVSDIARKIRAVKGNMPEEGGEDPIVKEAEREVAKMFARMDTNHDEVITFSEYLAAMYIPGKWDPEAEKAAHKKALEAKERPQARPESADKSSSRCTIS